MTSKVAMLFRNITGQGLRNDNAVAKAQVAKRRSLRPSDRIIYPQEVPAMTVAFVKTGMDNMFASSFFSICTVTEAIEAMRVNMTPYTSRHLTLLRQLHCVNWKNMPEEVFESIPQMLSEIFLEGPFTPSTSVTTIDN